MQPDRTIGISRTRPDEFPLEEELRWQRDRNIRWRTEKAKKVAVKNKKGGTAKTMTAAALGAYAARLLSTGRSIDETFHVLYWDMDEQNSLSRMLRYKPRKELGPAAGTFFDYILSQTPQDKAEKKIAMVHTARVKMKGIQFSLIPAGGPNLLDAVELKIKNEQNYGNPNWFSDLVAEFEHYYDLIVFDTGPSSNALHRLVTSVVDEVIIPFDGIEAFEMIGDLTKELKATRTNGDLNALLCMVKYQKQGGRSYNLNNNSIYRKAVEVFPDFVCNNGVRESWEMKKAFNQPPLYKDFDPHGEYKALIEEILRRWDDPARPNFFDDFDHDRFEQYEEAIEDLKRYDDVAGAIEYAERTIFQRPSLDEDSPDPTSRVEK
jgi:cellulose biosynthesis protein BcsQ